MKAFKILLDGNDHGDRHGDVDGARLLASALNDDFPDAEIVVVEIDQETESAVDEETGRVRWWVVEVEISREKYLG